MADYGAIQDHAHAVLALLYATDHLTVYPAQSGGPTTVPAGAAPPYVSVHMAGDWASGETLRGSSTRTRVRIYTHCVGANDIAARAVLDLVRSALLDAVPSIPGRACFPIRSEIIQPPQVTEPVAQTAVTITATWRLESVPGRDGS